MHTVARILSMLVLFLSATISQADDAAEEIKRLQGRFERTFTNAAGTMFRAVKEVVGDKTTVTTYDDVGNLVEAHTSSYKVEKRGPVRVLSFFNATVTAGREKGFTDSATRSYIYRFDGEAFAEVWGILEGDDSPPRILIWRRLKDSK